MHPKKPWKNYQHRERDPYNSRHSIYNTIASFAGRGKAKHLWIGLGAFLTVVILGLAVLGYGGYRIALEFNQTLTTWTGNQDPVAEPSLKQSAPSLAQTEKENPLAQQNSSDRRGFVGEFVTTLSQGWVESWLQETLGGAPIAQVQSGLACFDALGGPSADAIIERVRAQIPSDPWKGKLDQLEQAFARGNGPRGASACAHWILNS